MNSRSLEEKLIFSTNIDPGPSDSLRHTWLPRIVNLEDALEESEEGPFSFDKPGEGFVRSKKLCPSRPPPTQAPARIEDFKRLELDSASFIFKQAFCYLILYLAVGVLIYSCNKDKFSGNKTNLGVDALFFCIWCTIGYGDISPRTTSTKLFACFFLLVGFGFINKFLEGMVTYVLDKQENHLLDTAKSYIVDVKKGRMRIRTKVVLALCSVVVYIFIGTMVMHIAEGLGWTDSFYLSAMSVTAVGYGDHVFRTIEGRLFASFWLLLGTLTVARAFLYFAEARIDKRNRLIAKWILQRDFTCTDFMDADIDGDGVISKSEYIIYKLIEMGKVQEKDIFDVVKQFNRLDPEKSGALTFK